MKASHTERKKLHLVECSGFARRKRAGLAFALLATSCARASTKLPIDAADEPIDAAPSASLEGGAFEPPVEAGAPPFPVRWRSVLIVGDSMVGGRNGLTKSLEARFDDAGVRTYSNSWTSAGIRSMSEADRLEKLLEKLAPDGVVLVLGMNNVTVPSPDAYAEHVRNIAKKIAPRECFWVGPPPFTKPELGIVRVIRENAAPCRFFDSSKLVIERQTDDLHPTDRGGETWGAEVWAFMAAAEDAGAAAR